MITSSTATLQQMKMAGDDGRPVPVHLGLGHFAETYRGYRIRQHLWQGAGPAGQWFWQAQSDTDLIGETVLYSGAERDVQREIVHDAMRAIDHMLDDQGDDHDENHA